MLKNALLEIISPHYEFHLFSRCRLRCQLGTCPDTFEFWRRIENSSTIKWKLYDTIGVKSFWRHIIWVQLLFWSEFYSHYWRILSSSVWFSDLKNSDDSWFTDKVQTGKVEIKDNGVSYMALFPPEFLLVKQTASELYISPVRILQEFHEELRKKDDISTKHIFLIYKIFKKIEGRIKTFWQILLSISW